MRADPDRLAQVVANLLSNAIKFSPADNEVVVAIERRGKIIRLSVRDHGPGISDDFKLPIAELCFVRDIHALLRLDDGSRTRRLLLSGAVVTAGAVAVGIDLWHRTRPEPSSRRWQEAWSVLVPAILGKALLPPRVK